MAADRFWIGHVFSRLGFPRQRHPRHGRRYLLGLAGGVSDCDGDFWGWISNPAPSAPDPSRVQVARQSVPLPSPLSPLPLSIVGRITGMADCRWVLEESEIRIIRIIRKENPQIINQTLIKSRIPCRPRLLLRPCLGTAGDHVQHGGQGHFGQPGSGRSEWTTAAFRRWVI